MPIFAYVNTNIVQAVFEKEKCDSVTTKWGPLTMVI